MQVRSKTRIFDVPTPAEDDAINAGALSDPDNPPLTDAQLINDALVGSVKAKKKTAA